MSWTKVMQFMKALGTGALMGAMALIMIEFLISMWGGPVEVLFVPIMGLVIVLLWLVGVITRKGPTCA